MLAHNIIIKVFIKEDEEFEKTKEAFLNFFPFNLEENKIKINETKAKGFEEKEIRILEITLEKNKLIVSFLHNLEQTLSKETKEILKNQLESRLDEDCKFYLRFAKDRWIKDKELFLTDQGNCFHIKIAIAAFPKKKENALPIIRNIFKLKEEDN